MPGPAVCLTERSDGHLGEQDDYLSQGHPVSRGHPSQQWQHDPFSSANWLSWNKGSPKVLAASLVWTPGCYSWVGLIEAISFTGASMQSQETPESPSGSPSETQEHFHSFLCSEMLTEHFAAGRVLHWKLPLGELCLQGRVISILQKPSPGKTKGAASLDSESEFSTQRCHTAHIPQPNSKAGLYCNKPADQPSPQYRAYYWVFGLKQL